MQFAGSGIAVRVGGVTAGQGAVEIAGAHGIELIGEFVVGDSAFDEGQRASSVGQHVRVGPDGLHSGTRVERAGCGLSQGGAYRRAADPAIAIPAGLPVAQGYPVHHAIAGEPVIGRRVDLCGRVRSVAQVAPVQVLWDVPGDIEVGRGHLGGDRRQEAF